MAHETPKQKPGHLWSKSEAAKDSKGEEFANPLERHGQKGSRWIETAKSEGTSDTSDLQPGERRGAVKGNTGEVQSGSAHRVKTTEG